MWNDFQESNEFYMKRSKLPLGGRQSHYGTRTTMEAVDARLFRGDKTDIFFWPRRHFVRIPLGFFRHVQYFSVFIFEHRSWILARHFREVSPATGRRWHRRHRRTVNAAGDGMCARLGVAASADGRSPGVKLVAKWIWFFFCLWVP